MTGLSREQLLKALAYSDDGGGEEFELVPATANRKAVVVELHPVTPADYVRFCIRRIKGERERYLATTAKGIEDAQAEAKGEEPTEEEVEAAVKAGLLDHAERQIDSGLESMAAFVACSMRQPGDATLEALLAGKRTLPRAYAVANRLTHELDPDFFEGVSEITWGAQTPTTTSPDASSKPGSEAAI